MADWRENSENSEPVLELQRELQMSRAAAAAESDDLTREAREEAARIVASATAEANESNRVRAAESLHLERRLGILHQALADAEARFRRLAATAANDLGSLQVVLNEAETDLVEPPLPEKTTIDLTESAPQVSADSAEMPTGGMVEKSPDVGFYQRRLAGLRDRLEKSGNPPE